MAQRGRNDKSSNGTAAVGHAAHSGGKRQPPAQVVDDSEYYTDEESPPPARPAPPSHPIRRPESSAPAAMAEPARTSSKKVVVGTPPPLSTKPKRVGGESTTGTSTIISVSTCEDKLVSDMIKGDFQQSDTNHGKPVYQKTDGKVGVFIYYWDLRDGQECSGWWIGHKVGGDQVWAYAPQHTSLPPAKNWHVPHDGGIDKKLRLTFTERAGGGGRAGTPEKAARREVPVAATNAPPAAAPPPLRRKAEEDPRLTMPGAAEVVKERSAREPHRKKRREAEVEEVPTPKKSQVTLKSRRGDTSRNKQSEEDPPPRKGGEDVRRKLVEKRRRQEEEDAEEERILEEKQARRREQEVRKQAELKRKEEDARRRAEEEAQRRDEERRRREEEEARKEAEKRRKEEARRKREEEEARKRAEEEARERERRKREEEARRKREEEARKREEEEDARRQAEAAKRAEEEETREKEQAAADVVKAVIKKLRMVNPGSAKPLIAEVKIALERQMQAMGSLADKIKREVERQVQEAEDRVKDILEQRRKEREALLEAERKKVEDEERMNKFSKFLKEILNDVREAEDYAEEATDDSNLLLKKKETPPEELVKSSRKILDVAEKGQDLVRRTLKELTDGFDNMHDVQAARGVKGEVQNLDGRLKDAQAAIAKVVENLEATHEKAQRKLIANKRMAKRDAEFQAANRSGNGHLSREDVAYFSAEQYGFKLPTEVLDSIMTGLGPITVEKFQRMRGKVAIAKSEAESRKKRAEEAAKKAADVASRVSLRDESSEEEQQVRKDDTEVRGRGRAKWVRHAP